MVVALVPVVAAAATDLAVPLAVEGAVASTGIGLPVAAAAAVVTVAGYAGYKMLSGGGEKAGENTLDAAKDAGAKIHAANEGVDPNAGTGVPVNRGARGTAV